jgi:hypothetical protein
MPSAGQLIFDRFEGIRGEMAAMLRLKSICSVSASIIGVLALACLAMTLRSQTRDRHDGLTKIPYARAALYALPLVIMDLTREESLAASGATPNQFFHVPVLANDSFRTVVRPNVDTLYSSAWLDLTAEPVVMTLPPSDGRFFMIQCMDAWTNVFADPGVRTLGNKAATYEIVGPDWHGPTLAGAEEIRAPTRMVWVLARVFAGSREDLPAARAYQSKLDIRPLSRVNDPAFQPAYPRPGGRKINPIMMDVLKDMGAEAFFERFMVLTVANPAAAEDAPFIKEVLDPLGMTPGRQQAWERIDPSDRRALAAALEHVLEMMFSDRVSFHWQWRNRQQVNGWDLPSQQPGGVFGTRYPARAAVAALGLAAKVHADGIHFGARVDATGSRLNGGRAYRLTFGPGGAPPARAFWSLTLYDDKGYLVANPFRRYAARPGEGLVYEPDGSLVIYLQPDDPGSDHRLNWLPTPPGQTYELSLRAYWPNEALLNGQWTPPPVVAAD